ncbi:MAG: hypothetical protein GF332_04435 [Candidatus Moranbacteria bacterium]|nr:hypothetical protein [Candidatus Moranbacteria bacterium]
MNNEDKLESKQERKKILKDNPIRFYFTIAMIANIVSWLLVVVKLVNIPGDIILNYNAYIGVRFKGDNKSAFLLPAVGLFVIILNQALAIIFRKNGLAHSRILAAAGFLFNLIIIVAISALIYVNQGL